MKKPSPKRKDVREEMDSIEIESLAVPEEKGIGMEELATEDVLEKEKGRDSDNAGLPSDMHDVGDPDAGDVGVPGGYAAGGNASLGGSGGIEKDKPMKDRTREEDVEGTGNINSKDK